MAALLSGCLLGRERGGLLLIQDTIDAAALDLLLWPCERWAGPVCAALFETRRRSKACVARLCAAHPAATARASGTRVAVLDPAATAWQRLRPHATASEYLLAVTAAQRQLVREGESLLVVIDSLSDLLLRFGPSPACRALRDLLACPGVHQVAAVLHTDAHRDPQALALLRHVAGCCITVDAVERAGADAAVAGNIWLSLPGGRVAHKDFHVLLAPGDGGLTDRPAAQTITRPVTAAAQEARLEIQFEGVPFKLSRSSAEDSAKSRVALPYKLDAAAQQHALRGAAGGAKPAGGSAPVVGVAAAPGRMGTGRIFNVLDEDDSDDDDDLDDDLDI